MNQGNLTSMWLMAKTSLWRARQLGYPAPLDVLDRGDGLDLLCHWQMLSWLLHKRESLDVTGEVR
jgi:hypothetical protein